MAQSSNSLAALLASKTPEAMYDALYAGRYLTAEGQDSPAEVLALIKRQVHGFRQRALMPPSLMQRLTAALAGSEYLNEEGRRLASEKVVDDCTGDRD